MKASEKGLRGDQRGFTLLEMLVVISIVGILSVVAVPRFNTSVRLANTARVQADLQVLNSAIVLYQAEKGSNPNAISDLSDYVANISTVKPPKGDCQGRDGNIITVTDTTYGLNSDKTEATCQGETLSAFGRKE